MKVVIFKHPFGFEVGLQIIYLQRKNIPFWLYEFNFKKGVFQKIRDYSEMPLDNDTTAILLKDKGDFILHEYRELSEIPDSYFPDNDSLRYESDFIALVEEFADEVEELLEVIEIPEGERYRINSSFDVEHIEFEKNISWLTATK